MAAGSVPSCTSGIAWHSAVHVGATRHQVQAPGSVGSLRDADRRRGPPGCPRCHARRRCRVDGDHRLQRLGGMTVQRCQSAQRAGDQSKPDVVDRCAAIASGGSEVGERSAALDRGLKAARTIQAAAWFSRSTLCRTGSGRGTRRSAPARGSRTRTRRPSRPRRRPARARPGRTILEVATAEDRAVITDNVKAFRPLAAERLARGDHTPG